MLERDIVQELKASLDRFESSWYYKIPDTPPRLRKVQRFSHPRPFDICFLYNGVFFAIEAKIIKGPSGFPFKSVTVPEIDNLIAVDAAGGNAYVAISYRFQADQRHRALYFISINDFIWLRDNLTRESIPFKLFTGARYDDYCIPIVWLGNGIWDLSPVILGDANGDRPMD